MALPPGTRLGPYEVQSLLGAGGMGEVYRASDLRLGRDVAIKVLPPGFATNPVALERFEREARVVSALAHPNACTLFDIGVQDATRFIVMEFLDGQSLREVIGSRPLPFPSVLEWGIQIASALEAAHQSGIIHRDIKPANIFITRRGVAKLLDFGLAKFESPPVSPETAVDSTTITELTMPGVPIGTVSYMSPEQAQGFPAAPSSDLFSLGATLYEMVTGCRAFPGNSTAEVFASILGTAPIRPSRLSPSIPRGFDGVVARLLEKSPEARGAGARELITALEAFTNRGSPSSDVPISAAKPSTPASPARIQSIAVLPLMELTPIPIPIISRTALPKR